MTLYPGRGPTIAQLGTSFAAQSVGAAYTATSGTITTTTSTVTTGNVGLAGNVTVYIFGTYAGVTVNFEASPDNTNWFSWPMQREQTGAIEASPVLASNTAASWTIDAPGFSFFRVRASAWTSGTANVVINPGSYPITPVVSAVQWQPSTKVAFSLTAAAVTTVTTEALLSMVSVRGVTAAGAATSQTVTTGKTLRITSITIAVVASGAAAIVQGNAILRARASGSLVTTDPALWRGRVSSNSTVQQSAGWMSATFPDGLDLPSGTVFGFSTIASVTTGAWDISLNGYEF